MKKRASPEKYVEQDQEIAIGMTRIATNNVAAAAVSGLPLIVVQRAKDRGCPAFRGNGKIDCEVLLDFVAENPDLLEGLDNTIDPRVQKAWDNFESRMTRRQKRLMLSKHLIGKEVVRQAWFRNTIGCKTKLYQAENTISVELGMRLGLDNEKINLIKEVVMHHQRLAIREMFVGEWGKVICPSCNQEITS